MGLFDMFGGSFEDKVTKVMEEVKGLGLGVHNLSASVDRKIVTLSGEAKDIQAKTLAMEEISRRLEAASNIINRIHVVEPAPQPTPTESQTPEVQIYEVKSGDTLGAIAQRIYGKASLYPKIFEANRDVLDDPNLIKVGQKLKIPQLD